MGRGHQSTWANRRLQQDDDRLDRKIDAAAAAAPSRSSVQIVGALMLLADNATPPSGWREANGGELRRSDYPEAFEAFGETHGPGDGSTTFNIPNPPGAPALTTYFVYIGRD